MERNKSHAKKQEILQLSTNLIAKEGISSISFRKIANASGYTVGSIQNFFGSQENFYIEIMEYVEFCAMKRTEKLELFQHGISLEDFILYSEQLVPLDDVRKTELITWITLVCLSSTYDRIAKKSQDLLLKNYEAMEKIFDLMKFSGIFSPDLDTSVSVSIYYSFLEGLSQHSFIEPQKYNCSYMKELIRFFVAENFLTGNTLDLK